jgi:2-succinyl-5-enolpyruvyl-6-hydroxy-3-cyclohexene-1-carboxylate synthase
MEKSTSTIDMQCFATEWERYPKRMILVGQLPPDHGLHEVLSQLARQNDVVILAEHLANLPLSEVTGHFDAVLSSLSTEEQAAFAPDLVITVGGHITSKRVKQFLRKHAIREQWDIRPNGHVTDTYQSLTTVVPVEPALFFRLLSECIDSKPALHDYVHQWEERSLQIEHQLQNYVSKQPFSDLKAVAAFMHGLPDHSTLQLSNSSPLRYAQLFALKPTIDVFSNRGTNGIDGVLSTAVGHAAENQKLTFLLIGDLSFFYDINGLWNRYISPRLRIVLINNGGGNLFHLIGGPKSSSALDESIAYKHSTTAKERATTLGFRYLSATIEQDYIDQLPLLWEVEENQAVILEVFTQTEINSIVFNSLYQSFKTHVQ